MCGITGIVHWDGQTIERTILQRMADTLIHRGPDEQGFYLNKEQGTINYRSIDSISVGFAHRRLSIIDLSSGQQPLCNEDRTVWIVFNGEIYNFQSLKNELIRLGHHFKTHSDTEVIVHSYEEWGPSCLDRLNGMFAFAIWDEKQQLLFIARDRIGKKPLYYRSIKDTLVFGSELKAIMSYPGIEMQLEETAVIDYFKRHYIPDPKTVFKGINKLPPAHYLIATKKSGISIKEYWDVQFDGIFDCSELELEDQLFDLLYQAVHDRMISEVPLGAFLSGGVDSSGIVALMAHQSPNPIVTCSIGFDDPKHDESRFAAHVASQLGTDHHQFFVRDNFLDVVQRLPAIFDEPFADSSAIPTYYVCKMARQRVTVALSGDGGDETFGGYDKYFKGLVEQLFGQFMPKSLLKILGKTYLGGGLFQQKARTLTAQALRLQDQAFYKSTTFMSDQDLRNLLNPEIGNILKNYDPFEYTGKFFNKLNTDDHLSRMLYTDIKTYLPNDILVKVDRTSMANSLEVRAPLLDYRVVEFAAHLTNRMKIRWGNKKYLLKKAFARKLPTEVFRRPKHGFTVPIDAWFRGDLAPLAKEIFFSTSETAELLNVSYIRRIWEDHQNHRMNCGYTLWSILMFAIWNRNLHCKNTGIRSIG